MTKQRERKTTKQKPAWEAQAREEASKLGVSEAKVTRRVEKELLRLVAEKIAQHEITRRRAQHVASRKAAAPPSVKAQKAPRRKKVSRPGASDLKEKMGHNKTIGTEPTKVG
jgi:hypothetical protein